MPLDVKISTTEMNRALDRIGRGVEKAAVDSMNRTTLEVQDRLKLEIHAKLATRTSNSAQFLERMVKFNRGDMARANNLTTRIAIEGPEGDPSKAELLTRHIDGGTHSRPGGPLSSFYIPSDAARPSRMSVVPRNLYPTNLRLADRLAPSGMLYAKRHMTRTGKVQLKGKQRTFILSDAAGRPYGIYQREGPHDIQLLWFYTARVTDRARYDFFGIARRTFVERFPIVMNGILPKVLGANA